MWSSKFCLKPVRRVVSWQTPRLLSLWCRMTWNPAKPFPWMLRSRMGLCQSRTVFPSMTRRRGSSWRSASGCRGRWWSCQRRTGTWGWVSPWSLLSVTALTPFWQLAWMLAVGVALPLPLSLVQPPRSWPGLVGCSSSAVPARGPRCPGRCT